MIERKGKTEQNAQAPLPVGNETVDSAAEHADRTPFSMRAHHTRFLIDYRKRGLPPEDYVKKVRRVYTYNPIFRFGKPGEYRRDLFGDTPEQAQAFANGLQDFLEKFESLPDDHPVQITGDIRKDAVCESCAIGEHCSNTTFSNAEAGYIDMVQDKATELGREADTSITKVNGIPRALSTSAGTLRAVLDSRPFGFLKSIQAERKYESMVKDPERAERPAAIKVVLTSETQSQTEQIEALSGYLRETLDEYPEGNVLVVVDNARWSRRVAEAIRTGEELWSRSEKALAEVNAKHKGRIIWIADEISDGAKGIKVAGELDVVNSIVKGSVFPTAQRIRDAMKAKFLMEAQFQQRVVHDRADTITSKLNDMPLAAAVVLKDISHEDIVSRLEAAGHSVSVAYPEGETRDDIKDPLLELQQRVRAGQEVTAEDIHFAEKAERKVGLGAGILYSYDEMIRKATGRRLFYRGDRAVAKVQELRERKKALIEKQRQKSTKSGPGAMHRDAQTDMPQARASQKEVGATGTVLETPPVQAPERAVPQVVEMTIDTPFTFEFGARETVSQASREPHCYDSNPFDVDIDFGDGDTVPLGKFDEGPEYREELER